MLRKHTNPKISNGRQVKSMAAHDGY